MDFKDLIKTKREEFGLSVSDLSKITKISENTLHNYEDGFVLPDIESLLALCNAFNVTPNDMLLGVAFEYVRDMWNYGYRKHYLDHTETAKLMTWDEKVSYVLNMFDHNDCVSTAYIQRKLRVSYFEADKLLKAAEKVRTSHENKDG